MTKDHFVPRFIIRKFTDAQGKIYSYNKLTNKIRHVDHYDELQEVNFYSKKPIRDLNPKIDINPIFSKINLDLEKNLSMCLEDRMGKILHKKIPKILLGYKINLSEKEKEFVKEYVAIQHIRTKDFKQKSQEIIKKMNQEFLESLPNKITNIENNREIGTFNYFRKIINEKLPHLKGRNQTREAKIYELKFKKRNEDTPFLERIRQESINKILGEELPKIKQSLEEIEKNPDKHSTQIIDMKLRNSFFKNSQMDKKDPRFMINNTQIPFVLSDTGIVIMGLSDGIREERRVYFPIHPKILIEISESKPEKIDEQFVKDFNRVAKDESFLNVYSNSQNAFLYQKTTK